MLPRAEAHFARLSAGCKTRPKSQVENLRRRVLDLARDEGARFRVLGYELMQMSDLFIGKPGGMTTSEALACGLPMVIFSPIPGQEERNSDHLLEEGAAIKCTDLTAIPYKIDLLLVSRRGWSRCVGRRWALPGPRRRTQSCRHSSTMIFRSCN